MHPAGVEAERAVRAGNGGLCGDGGLAMAGRGSDAALTEGNECLLKPKVVIEFAGRPTAVVGHRSSRRYRFGLQQQEQVH